MSAAPLLTPEFLLWSVETTCPLRADQDGSDPERVERQLRAARAVRDARREGRIFEGIAVQPPDGFRVPEALAIYGGESAALECCRDCPANVLRAENAPALAGCYGCVALPLDPAPVHAAVERGFEIAASCEQFDIRPRWYGLWLDSPVHGQRLLDAARVLDASPIEEAATKRDLDELLPALNAAFNRRLRLHVRLYPPGRVEDGWWRLAPHCPRCQAGWPGDHSRQCSVCGYVGHAAPDKRRRARGRRPYAPLDRILGAGEAAAFLARYFDSPARGRSPDRAQNPLPPGPPDIRPDDSSF